MTFRIEHDLLGERQVEVLREITGIGLARAENMVEATQNTDVFVEVSGILRALASSLIKMCADLRLLSSGPDAGFAELSLPARQAGSSIIPGKINPVIPEAATQAVLMTLAFDQDLTNACSLGSLELNAFMPLVADCLLRELSILSSTCDMLRSLCVEGILANEDKCRKYVENGTSAATALVELIGYEKATETARTMSTKGKSLREIVVENGWLSNEEYDELTSPESVNRLGSSTRSEK